MEGLVKVIFGITIVLMYLIVSEMDYQDAVLEEKQYIKEVCENYIPNYKEWDINCATRSLK
jgi:hypothetical protein